MRDYNLSGLGVIWNGGGTLTVAFPISTTTRAITLTPVDDLFDEVDSETVIFTTANGTGYTHGTTSQTVTITDDDSCPTTAPVLNSLVPTVFCDIISQNLNEYTNTPNPPNAPLTWSTNPDPLVTGDHVPGIATTANTYYGFFYDVLNSCASTTLEVTLTLNNTPSAGTPNNAAACIQVRMADPQRWIWMINLMTRMRAIGL